MKEHEGAKHAQSVQPLRSSAAKGLRQGIISWVEVLRKRYCMAGIHVCEICNHPGQRAEFHLPVPEILARRQPFFGIRPARGRTTAYLLFRGARHIRRQMICLAVPSHVFWPRAATGNRTGRSASPHPRVRGSVGRTYCSTVRLRNGMRVLPYLVPSVLYAMRIDGMCEMHAAVDACESCCNWRALGVYVRLALHAWVAGGQRGIEENEKEIAGVSGPHGADMVCPHKHANAYIQET